VQAKVLADCDRAAAGVSAARAKLATADEMLAEQGGRLIAHAHRRRGEGDRLALLSAEVERATTRLSRLDALDRTCTPRSARWRKPRKRRSRNEKISAFLLIVGVLARSSWALWRGSAPARRRDRAKLGEQPPRSRREARTRGVHRHAEKEKVEAPGL
jgi:hypothetical protein